MSQTLKLMGGAAALITAALVGGTLIGSALAAPSGSSDRAVDSVLGDAPAGERSAYCQVFLDTFAEELGVETEELAPAAQAAAIAVVEAAVENGDLTEEQGAALIERINNRDGSACAWIGFHLRHWAHHGAHIDFKHDLFVAAAEALGMEPGELREALGDATLEEVAQAEGVDYADVVAAALAAAEEKLDAAVEARQISQDKADQILERLETWLNEGGPGNWGDRPGRGGADAEGTAA